MHFNTLFLALASLLLAVQADYWMGSISHQGLAPYAGSGYSVFRNVKDYGAVGDGVTDDTAAINAAITAGSRCGEGCASSTTTPAVVYFPAGTYLISSSIIPYYFTMLIGDANSPPTLKATSGFSGFGLINGNPYYTSDLNWVSVNVFYRQIRNFIIDTTNVAATTACTGIHWPTSQATSLQNVVFNMPTTSGVVHVGLFIESGSGGFMSDLTFNGGATGASMGNQQYTMRNFVFNNCGTAIIMLWDWDWTFQGLTIANCGTGIDMSAGGNSDQDVGSVILIDSTFTNVDVGIITAYTSSGTPATAGSLILENINLDNVPVMVQEGGSTVLAGTTGTTTIAGWGEGHSYTLTSGPTAFEGTITANSRPNALLGSGTDYYTKSKPQYESLSASDFVSVRSSGAVGNGATDDTAALQSAINSAVASGKVVYIDYGLYLVTSTLKIPAGAKIVGEAYPVILASGSHFSNIDSPEPVVQIGTSGETGTVALSDFVVSGQGAMAGAVLIEYNLAAPSGSPSGLWDVHTRIGGFTGSQLQVAQCVKDAGSSTVNTACIGAYMSMHVTSGSSGLYLENVWLWSADHDIDDSSNTQITVYSGRGLFVESTAGPVWLVGTAAEHHALYNYQFYNTKNLYASQLQTETPYYQPTPNSLTPFTANTTLNDPTFDCSGVSGNCDVSWGLRIIESSNVFIYGANHYSFFVSYEQNCSTFSTGESCQARIVRLQGTLSNVNIYNLNTIGSESMIDWAGTTVAVYSANENVYPSTIALFRTG
ncbi:Glucan 1,3-beta-glucosidase [Cytospora mali]|uniref:Glucan 1,3-beta-glucosidase n=1 Tax=Cytospora mali TaxID=578113 RepID=A0A194UP51_CYTMA|nr:Glucan 1,3-beta-glucosidase [Valsa mali var. pyri (nom. inval.)]